MLATIEMDTQLYIRKVSYQDGLLLVMVYKFWNKKDTSHLTEVRGRIEIIEYRNLSFYDFSRKCSFQPFMFENAVKV